MNCIFLCHICKIEDIQTVKTVPCSVVSGQWSVVSGQWSVVKEYFSSLFPVPCSLFPVPCSLFPCHNDNFSPQPT
ncbi:MAG: hypothetical protein ACKPA8_01225 [Dolichospermum sp.]